MTDLLRRYLDRRAILIGVPVGDGGAAIDLLAERLREIGCVHASWGPAARAREEAMPTGLPLGDLNAAIPHTDPEHVVQAAVGLAILPEPVRFRSMDDPDLWLDVRVIFALAIRDKAEQIPLLQAVIGTLADEQRLRRLAGAGTADEVLEALGH
ncbi:PTS sugar transporter subunit IIA [Aureimonas sp. AU22]|uniref:PTS sugar transporter subunit IIA n=1 Tax=Aureimonas sp. AU22 TaxID=1638162 RepID=UPI000783B3EB|nr:PTS sugar transporter subunit IIA [Aureimonas sp. AU22]